jgi:membrane protease YdiL (CAAX protease family)
MSTKTSQKRSILNPEIVEPTLNPAGFQQSILLFGLPTMVTVFFFYVFRPYLENLGYDQITAYLAALCIPVALLFASALVFYNKVEGHPLTWRAFSKRMRYPRIRWQDFAWGLAIFVLGMAGYVFLARLVMFLIQTGWMPLPTKLPALVDPRASFTMQTLLQSAGGVIRGRWDIAALYSITFFFNIVGEELWWRGIIFPRQELVFGRATWLVHGLFWAGFHIFKWWDVLPLLPICLLISYCAQISRNNWGALIGHALTNGSAMLIILTAVIN